MHTPEKPVIRALKNSSHNFKGQVIEVEPTTEGSGCLHNQNSLGIPDD